MKHISAGKENGELLVKEDEEQINNQCLAFMRETNGYTQKILPACDKKTLQGIIRGRVSTEAIVHTDKWRGYDGLVDVGYDKYLRINHSQEFSDMHGNHINGIENFWSFTKRRLVKFNGVKVHFNYHLKESEWRYKKKPEQLYEELIVLLRKYQNLILS